MPDTTTTQTLLKKARALVEEDHGASICGALWRSIDMGNAAEYRAAGKLALHIEQELHEDQATSIISLIRHLLEHKINIPRLTICQTMNLEQMARLAWIDRMLDNLTTELQNDQ